MYYIKKWFLVTIVTLFSFYVVKADIVSFDESSMSKASDEFRKTYTRLYNRNHFSLKEVESEPLIPKIIHMIWIGPRPLPEKYKPLMESWRKFHPDWEIKLWTNEDVATMELENQDIFDRAVNYGMKSDILRMEILWRYGGLYVDLDFECYQPFDHLHHAHGFYCGLHSGACVIGNSMMAAAKHHPLMRMCIDHFKNRSNKEVFATHEPSLVMRLTGPGFFTEMVKRYIRELVHKRQSCKRTIQRRRHLLKRPQFVEKLKKVETELAQIIVYPSSYFFPIEPQDRHSYWNKVWTEKDIQERLKPETLAVHWWGTSWC